MNAAIEQWGTRLSDAIRQALDGADTAAALRLVREGDGMTKSLGKEFTLMVRGLGITIRVIVPLLAKTAERLEPALREGGRGEVAALLHRFSNDLVNIAKVTLGEFPGSIPPIGTLAREVARCCETLLERERDFERAQAELAGEIERALAAADRDRARRLLDRKEQGQYLPFHDRLVRFMAESFAWVLERCGPQELERFHLATAEAQRAGFTAWELMSPTDFARATAFLLKQHMGQLVVREDDEKFTFEQRLCGSGGRLQTMGAYSGPGALPFVETPGALTFGERRLPVYCSHCPIWNGAAPIRWFGHAQWVFEHPARPDGGCTSHIYKRPADIPAAFTARVTIPEVPAPTGRAPATGAFHRGEGGVSAEEQAR